MINIKEKLEYSSFDMMFAQKPNIVFESMNPLPLDKDEFIDFLVRCGEAHPRDTYHNNVQSMCEHFVYWAYLKLKDTSYNIKYVCGNFGLFEHYWIEYNDIIIDFTLKQFNPEYHDVAIVKKENGYHKLLYNNVSDALVQGWVNNLLDRAFAGEDVSEVDEFDEIMNISVENPFDK